MPKDHYSTELAATVAELFNNECTDPNAEEIAEAYFEGKLIGGEVVDGVKKRLRRIKAFLETEHGYPVYLVAAYYYTRQCGRNPADSIQARRCIPGGPKKSAMGIVLNTSDNDLIYQEALKQNIISAIPKASKAVKNIINAMKEGRMELADGGDLLHQLQTRIEIENQLKLTAAQHSLMRKSLVAAERRREEAVEGDQG